MQLARSRVNPTPTLPPLSTHKTQSATDYIKEDAWDATRPIRSLSMQSEISRFERGVHYPSFVGTPPNSPLHPDMASWNESTAKYLNESSIIIETDRALDCFKIFLEDYPTIPPLIGFLELPYLPHYPGNQPQIPTYYWRSAQLVAASQLPTLSNLRITLRASGLTEEIPEGDDNRRKVALEGVAYEYYARRPISLDTLVRAYDMELILQCRFLSCLDFIVINDSINRGLCAPADPSEVVLQLAEWLSERFKQVIFFPQQVWVRVKIEADLDNLGSKDQTICYF